MFFSFWDAVSPPLSGSIRWPCFLSQSWSTASSISPSALARWKAFDLATALTRSLLSRFASLTTAATAHTRGRRPCWRRRSSSGQVLILTQLASSAIVSARWNTTVAPSWRSAEVESTGVETFSRWGCAWISRCRILKAASKSWSADRRWEAFLY